MLKLVIVILGSLTISGVLTQEWNRQYVKKEHSLVKPYQGSGMNMPNWDFTGTTMVRFGTSAIHTTLNRACQPMRRVQIETGNKLENIVYIQVWYMLLTSHHSAFINNGAIK